MTKSLLRVLIALFIMPSTSTSQICADVLEQTASKELSIKLESEESWYVEGESVFFKMVFENKSSRPLLLPQDLDLGQGQLAQLFLVKHPEVPEGMWVDVITRWPMDDRFRPCSKTAITRLLLPGKKYEVPLQRNDFLESSKHVASKVHWVPHSPGNYRLAYILGNFELVATVSVKPISSLEMRWMSYPSMDGKSTKLRGIILAEAQEQTIVLVTKSLSRNLPLAEITNYFDYEDVNLRRSSTSPPHAERLFVLDGQVTFADPSSRVFSIDREIELLSQGRVIKTVNPKLYPPPNTTPLFP